MEAFAAELAAIRMDAADQAAAQALRDEVDELVRLDDADALMRLDQRVHRFVWQASQNPYLVVALERYFALSLRIWYLVLDRVPGLGVAVHDQVELLDALIARNGERARAVMRDHVLDFQREVIAAFTRAGRRPA